MNSNYGGRDNLSSAFLLVFFIKCVNYVTYC